MPTDLPDVIDGFIDEATRASKRLVVVNRTEPKPLLDLLDDGLGDQPVDVTERQSQGEDSDLVCLIDDGQVVATSSLAELSEAYLLVNADRYRTGTAGVREGRFPDVLTGLDEVEFRVQGFPASNKEKLLLILLSRFVEFRALEAAAGVHRATFQRLSRLDDEVGTRTVYQWLGDSGVETHVYGVDDGSAALEGLDVTVHAGESREYRRSWVVSFVPADGDDHVALTAVEVGANEWRGTWTYDPDRVERIDAYLETRF
jgi:hypothetical protein